MSNLFRDKYRIPSARLPSWNYSSEGMYFVTVCTREREHFFGTINGRYMCLSEIGQVVYNEWSETPGLRPDMHLQLGEWVVMPNHFHAILIIGANEFNNHIDDVPDNIRRDAMFASPPYPTQNVFGPQAKNLGSVMRGFKSAVTSFAQEANIPFGWQARYHDHVIRSYEEYLRISAYIACNIGKWGDDCFHSRRS